MASLHLQGQKKKLYKRKELLKDSFELKKSGKGLLIQIKEEEIFKMLIDWTITEDKDSPFEKIEPHKKFNTQAQYIIEI